MGPYLFPKPEAHCGHQAQTLHADLYMHYHSFQPVQIGKGGDTMVLWENTRSLNSVARVFKGFSPLNRRNLGL
jgi:hypothetical protein